MLEILLQVVGKTLRSATHGVDVHAVAASAHNAAQTTRSKLQIAVERLNEFGLVLGLQHFAHLGFRLLVIAFAKPQLCFGGHLL